MKKYSYVKLRIWYKTLKKAGIISNITSLGKEIRPKQPITQPFLSAIFKGKSSAPDYIYENIIKIWPYTNIEYFEKDHIPMIDFNKMILELSKKHKIRIKTLIKEIDDPHIQDFTTSRIADTETFQKVFDYINDKFGYSIDVLKITNAAGVIAIEDRDYEGKSDHVRRLWTLIEALKKQNMIINDKDFCEQTGVSQAQLANTKSATTKQDLTKDWLYNICLAFPQVSADWLLMGAGTMFRSSGSSMPVLLEMRGMLSEVYRAVNKD